jgi:hypothetical protein
MAIFLLKNPSAPLPLCGLMKHNGRSPGTRTLYDLIIFPISNIARNKDLGSFYAYSHFAGILPTDLIGAFLIQFFRITDYPA